MNLDDLRRVHKQCTYGAAQVFPCKGCGKAAEVVCPPDGMWCKACLPPDVVVMPFDDYRKLVEQKRDEVKTFLVDEIGRLEFGDERDDR